MYRKLLFIAAITAAMASCNNGGNSGQGKDSVDTVTVETLKRGTFDEPFTAQGKVKASRYADLAFENSLPIKAVYVRNGQVVAKGQPIAELDMFKMNNAIEQARKQVEQARLNMQDVIISQGYDPDKPQAVPENIKKLAQVKSGYSLALSQLEAATHDIRCGGKPHHTGALHIAGRSYRMPHNSHRRDGSGIQGDGRRPKYSKERLHRKRHTHSNKGFTI